ARLGLLPRDGPRAHAAGRVGLPGGQGAVLRQPRAARLRRGRRREARPRRRAEARRTRPHGRRRAPALRTGAPPGAPHAGRARGAEQGAARVRWPSQAGPAAREARPHRPRARAARPPERPHRPGGGAAHARRGRGPRRRRPQPARQLRGVLARGARRHARRGRDAQVRRALRQGRRRGGVGVRPLRLRLRNFGCFRGEHDVDFTGLNGDLFAIAGPTGSGKSTVLDALTWALYGQTPRLGKHLNEHIFSPGESELSVVVEFAAGGDEYRATRSLRRRRSGISSAAKLERRAEDGRWLNVPETDRIADYERALARAVGLDYDGYVRAVMLPQGAFDEFLRGNDAERREVIKALLRAYTIERMRELASRERDDAKELLGQARARLDTEYEGVTRERETELEGRVRELERDLAALRLEQREVQERLEGLAELERLDRELKAAAAELARLDAEEPAVEEARSALERADAA